MKFWEFFLCRPRFTFLVLFAIVFAGFWALFTLPREANPEVVVPIGIVTTVYPGASPKDVERLITDKIEDEIEELDDLDSFTSSSREGLSTVVVNFDAKADVDESIRALRDAVSTSEPNLANDAERPIVTAVNFADQPILILGLAISLPQAELKKVAEDFQNTIESVPGVSEVLLSGVREQELLISLDKRKLNQFSISISEVTQAIQTSNLSFPIGSIKTDNIRYSVRLDAEIVEPNMIANLPIKQINGTPIYLRDVADIKFGLAESNSVSRVSVGGEPSISAVTIMVRKKTGGNITKLVNQVFKTAEDLRLNTYPEAKLIVTWDAADEISKSLGQLSRNGLSTIIIIAALLFLLLGRKEAILAGISIPLTFLIGFIGLLLLGSSINFLSLFSLILALGIVVDNGIVITEGLHHHIGLGEEPLEAARNTIKEFQWPLISGTLTTVSAFLPMLMMGGVMGQFVRHIPITVNLVLIGSLFTALAIIPLLGARLYKKNKEASKTSIKARYVDPQMDKLHNWYSKTLRNLLNNKKSSKRFILGIIGAFIFSLALPITGILKTTMFPENDSDFFFINLETQLGSTLEVTDQATREVEEYLYDDPRIESFFVDIGRGNVFDDNAQNGSHIATFTANLYEDRQEKTTEILQDYRQRLANITSADINLDQLESGPPSGAPILISFRGPEINVLQDLADQAASILENIPGTLDVSTTFDESTFEFVIEVDREIAIKKGFSPLTIAQTVRTAVQGNNASSIRYEGEDIDVVVTQSLNPNAQDSNDRTITTIDEIKQMVLISPLGTEVSLGSMVEIKVKPSTSSVRHLDGLREAAATSQVTGTTPGEIFKQFKKQSSQLNIPPGYIMKLGGEAEDVADSFRDLFQALYIGLLLIAAILLLQFNSYRQPFFILMTLPLALIGVLPGLVLVGQDLSFPAFIGIIALSGVVVNDAIILIDKINKNRRQGYDKLEAIVRAAKARLQPILLTTITTIAGIFPLTISDPIWGSLGFSIIFGLLMATVLTLLVIPILYLKWGEKELS